MRRDDKEATDAQDISLYPPGMGAFLLATLCMLATHTCLLLSVYALYVQPIPNHEDSAGLILAVGALSAFLVIHPSFLLTRAKPRNLRFLGTLSTIYAVFLLLVSIWSLYVADPLIYIAGIGLTTATVCRLIYRSSRIRLFSDHYVRLWGLLKEPNRKHIQNTPPAEH
ncbi:hypothetical protein FE845_05285 [Marinobacter sp. 1-4A]|uniref:hypothetical protein n=1 Tax=unclassified Marinobacter TaxID=83889 RepID=UPI001903D987|nr:hypothetical protein [Marinobacter sp. 1-4A]MBK1850739.1 hypothetical protein [Marinobacter sp. 1-4A]